jgi:(1->4)-alpha-D-glucan 1-alpha-D-glucosylmutase
MTPDELIRGFFRDPEAYRRIPASTYRFQLDHSFAFPDAQAIVPYLADLGITDCYLSPFLQPSSDRSHGYDVSDHGRVNPALGGEEAYRAFAQALRERQMGQVVDVVPNHMGIAGSRNAWWSDVLENGPASPHAAYFDVDWDPLKPELKNKVLLPFLGDQYGRVLERGELTLEFGQGAFTVRYYDTVLPIAPRTYVQILRHRIEGLEAGLGKEHPHLLELQSIITALTHLPPQTETDPARLAERQREKQVIKRRLAALAEASAEVRAFVEENVRIFNGVRGEPASFDPLDQLLSAQAYRLAFWQVASDEINYRRFFDINELAAIRMEDPPVFAEAHRLIFRLVHEGWITGLRIDHPDGLYAPIQYFKGLQRGCFVAVARRLAGLDAGAQEAEAARWAEALAAEYDRRVAEDPASPLARPFYIVAEKIVMEGERLPTDWPVHGTTGYEFLCALNGLFVSTAAERSFEETYSRFVDAKISFRSLAYETKKLIMDTSMSSELNLLGHRLARISERHRSSRDFTDRSLTAALREIIACFPVYRTYIGEDGHRVSDRDRRFVEQAMGLAKRRNPTTSASIFDFIRDVLCFKFPEALTDTDREEQLTFVMKLQQLTGPIMAKGVEDTAFYRYNRLVSLNEVGGHPERFGAPVERFHQLCGERRELWPASLSATSTHDTKRSEDVRARITALSELPQEWRGRLRAWHRANRKKRGMVDGLPAPDKNEEYLLYQTLVGAWPFEPVSDATYAEFVERIQQYMFKAIREAKLNTSWVSPNAEHDQAVHRFVGAILDRTDANPFLDDFLPFQRKVAQIGIFSALAQTLIKVTAPGVPDFYQGTEIWNLSLVDPDNRRPVDYGRRQAMLADLRARIREVGSGLHGLARELLETKEDGRIKLYVTHRALVHRRDRPRLFLDGDYTPLDGFGAQREHLCALARRLDGAMAVTVVPRLVGRLTGGAPPVGKEVWGETWITLPADAAGRRYRNVFTGETVEAVEREGRPMLAAEAIFASFPVALLEQEAADAP